MTNAPKLQMVYVAALLPVVQGRLNKLEALAPDEPTSQKAKSCRGFVRETAVLFKKALDFGFKVNEDVRNKNTPADAAFADLWQCRMRFEELAPRSGQELPELWTV